MQRKVLGHFVNEDFFARAEGRVFLTKGGEEGSDLLRSLVGHLGNARAEAVTEGVLAGPGFTLIGARTGAVLCVWAVGSDLRFCRHELSPIKENPVAGFARHRRAWLSPAD